MNKFYTLLAAAALVAASASAQTLFTFDFVESSGGAGDSFAAKSIDSSLITSVTDFTNGGAAGLTTGNNAGAINIGPGTDAAGTSYTLGQFTDNYGQSNGYAATFDGTNANGLYGADAADYVGFSFTADDAFTLGSLDFDMAQGGGSGPRGFTATYNLNGGSFSEFGVAALNVGSSAEFGRYSFDFGNTSIAAADTVEVRLLGFSTGTNNSIRFDNVSVAVIPEPSSVVLMMGGLAVALAIARRRRK